tara:strand:- start:321 stop:1220 length:900 start_codon:yes stop_codon:yes gene_type:complete
MVATSVALSANRSKQELLDARAQVLARLEVVPFSRLPDVMEKKWDGRGKMTGTRQLEFLDLRVGILRPEHGAEGPPRPAVVFFHGGGFHSGNPDQFFVQADLYADRGAVAFCAEYRLKNNVEVTIAEQVEDARAAIRWVRQNAGAFNVDPDQIVAVGGSAGGYLALASAILPGGRPGAVPNAVVLYNPAIDFDHFANGMGRQNMELSLGGKIEAYSITPNLRKDGPPVILFHGEHDEKIPLRIARRFADRAQELGLSCELVIMPGEGHGFHNRDPYIDSCVNQSVRFLREHGIALAGEN